jgi:hypothetical protein
MGFYSVWVFPWVLDLVMRQKQLKPSRERVAKAASLRNATIPKTDLARTLHGSAARRTANLVRSRSRPRERGRLRCEQGDCSR